MAKGQRPLLPPEDEERLKQLAASGPETLQKRAQAILAWHDGATANEAARRAKLSVNQVQYLWRIYRRKGLDLFLIDNDSEEPRPAAKVAAPPEPDDSGTMTLEALCATHHVDMDHARHVAALAVQLFDATMSVHRLTQDNRALLEAAAIVHNVGFAADPPNHHLRGRDILMAQPLRGLSDDERRILACTTVFHRKKVRPDAEPVYLGLPADLRRDALTIAAILRVADGLDNSQTQTTQIADVQIGSEEVLIQVTGPYAIQDAAQAQKKADLWNRHLTPPIRVLREVVEQDGEGLMPLRPIVEATPSIHSTMSVSRAGRRFALHTLDRLDTLVSRLRTGDTSMLHTLAREASRLDEAAALAEAKAHRKEIRWFVDAVEALRIETVLAERAVALADEGGDSNPTYMAQALAWEAAARSAAGSLDFARYERLSAALRQEMAREDEDGGRLAVGYHAGAILWNLLIALRGTMEHGDSVQEALEAARRLEDHLAAFRDMLGPEVSQVLDILAPLESYLAAIHTTQAVLARTEPQPIKKGRKTIVPPLDATSELMRASLIEVLDSLADNLPAVWSRVNSVVFRRAFALAIAAP
jgi:hypothetical protein